MELRKKVSYPQFELWLFSLRLQKCSAGYIYFENHNGSAKMNQLVSKIYFPFSADVFFSISVCVFGTSHYWAPAHFNISNASLQVVQ